MNIFITTYIIIIMKNTTIINNEKKYKIKFDNLNNTWERRCSTCKKIIIHKTLLICKQSIKKECKSCSKTTKKIPPNSVFLEPLKNHWYRICPNCKEKLLCNGKTEAINNSKKICKRCLYLNFPKWSEEKKQILSKKAKERWSNPEYRQKLNKHFTIFKFKSIKKLISFNPFVCDWLDQKNKELINKGIFFRHQKNHPQGEFSIICYFADGYDEKNNIWFEYDEPHHESPSVKRKDKIKEKRIIGKLKCRFIRYSEKNKQLYEILEKGKILLNDFKDI